MLVVSRFRFKASLLPCIFLGALFSTPTFAGIPGIRLLVGEDPPARFSLGVENANAEVEVRVVRGHSNPAVAAEKLFATQFRVRSDETGTVDFDRAIPLAGWPRQSPESPNLEPSFRADRWGPLWSMRTVERSSLPALLLSHPEWQARYATLTYENVLYAFVSGNTVLKIFAVDFVRAHPTLKTVSIDASQEQFVGSFTYPDGCQQCPGLVIWGGSGGPVSPEIVGYYANRGIAVLSIQYFTTNPAAVTPYLTLWIRETPLEIFTRAIEWAKRQPQVDANRVAIMGGSRGGEVALLVGLKYPGQLVGVVAHRPHYASMSSALNGNTPIPLGRPETFSWTFGAEGIPYTPIAREHSGQGINELAEYTGGVRWHPDGYPVISVLPGFLDAERRLEAQGLEAVERVRIPVEQIRAPILATAGEDDGMWPAPKAVQKIAAARQNDSVPSEYRSLDIFYVEPEAGHVSSLPGTPAMESTRVFTAGSYRDTVNPDGTVNETRSIWVLGGNPEANHRGFLNFTRTTLRFLSSVYQQDLTPLPL